MTEREFAQQVWRMHDQISSTDEVKGKVLGVSFTTKSVRAYISGAPEWLRCELIEKHITGNGADGDDAGLVEELRNKIENQAREIERLQEEKKLLNEKISKNYLADLYRAVTAVRQGLETKKKKMEMIENGLSMIDDVISKMDVVENDEQA